MKHKGIFLIILVFNLAKVFAQQTIQLDEVVVADTQLQRYSDTQHTSTLSDSILKKNGGRLTQLLNYNSSIYFRENGLGMVSSASFRGTTAQQTAVLWNGININSQLNGQTDFNTVNTRVFDNITVRTGGGSVLFGSGAIGGSIHLNDRLRFGKGLTHDLGFSYGSFNTLDAAYKGGYSNEKFSVKLGLARLSTDNDYKFPGEDGSNLNGQFYNNNANLSVAYKLNDKNILKFYSYIFDGERHFSLIRPNENKTKYHDLNTRNLLEWDGFYGNFISKLKVAYVTEHYKYYQNLESDDYTDGEAKSSIGKYDLAYKLTANAVLNAVVDVTHTTGSGSSIPENSRTIGAFSLLYKHKVLSGLSYELTARKEITENYESPFLFSAGALVKISKVYSVRATASKNYRIPTFNDLYWAGSGNLDLQPETSMQYELGNNFKIGALEVGVTGYYNDITDMIQWVPQGALWKPINTQQVKTYGLEANLAYRYNIDKHTFSLQTNYAYTISKDEATGNQLAYVPYHKGTLSLGYHYKRINVSFQTLYTGMVYILTDNHPDYVVDGYVVGNLGFSVNPFKAYNFETGIQINNIWNKAYESITNRIMPGTNFNLFIQLNI